MGARGGGEIEAATVLPRGRPVFLRRAGTAEGPALVLLHGLPTSSYLWRHCLPGLAAALPGWRILAPDLPGYGRGSWGASSTRCCASWA